MIRPAIGRDFESIHRLILELAEYEKAPDEVITDASILEKYCSGVQPLAYAWVAQLDSHDHSSETQDQRIIGAAVCYIRYSTWKGPVLYLEDLIVEKRFRQNGYGQALLNAVIEFARTQGYKRVVWQVLDWNLTAIEFYKKYSVSFDESWINVTLDIE